MVLRSGCRFKTTTRQLGCRGRRLMGSTAQSRLLHEPKPELSPSGPSLARRCLEILWPLISKVTDCGAGGIALHSATFRDLSAKTRIAGTGGDTSVHRL